MAHALTSDEIRKQSTTLIANIRKAISSTPPDLQTAKFLTLELKQLNRLSNFRNQRFRSELQSLQANADSIFLSFNNLANEISHVRKSVVACLNFKYVFSTFCCLISFLAGRQIRTLNWFPLGILSRRAQRKLGLIWLKKTTSIICELVD